MNDFQEPCSRVLLPKVGKELGFEIRPALVGRIGLASGPYGLLWFKRFGVKDVHRFKVRDYSFGAIGFRSRV